MTTACKEKEAAWEFMVHMSSGQPARVFTQGRGLLPVRRSISADPVFQQNRFFKLAIAQASTWWRPPFSHKHWANYQDKIAPYWQQALRQEISVKDSTRRRRRSCAARAEPGVYRKPNSRAGVSHSTVLRSAGSGSQRWRHTSGGP